jgi:hypothetical protein
LQRGRGAWQFASVEQPAVQVCVFRSQTPLAPVHWAFDVHWTQVLLTVLQTGAPGGHAVVFVALHGTHWPRTQAGSATVGHWSGLPVPLSVAQATHLLLVRSQTGVLPVHWVAAFAAVHSTQRCDVTLHTGVAPVHRTLLKAVHWTQSPPGGAGRSQAGRFALGHAADAAVPLSPLHGMHVPAALQIGFVPVHRDESAGVH